MSCRGNLINTVNGSYLCGCTRGVYRGYCGDWWNRPKVLVSLSANELLVSDTTVMNTLAVLVSWELSECGMS